jgi:hypothetical protein
MQHLRVLSEAECYARLYGTNDDSSVSRVQGEPQAGPRPVLSGDDLRRLLEERLDARQSELFGGEAAA